MVYWVCHFFLPIYFVICFLKCYICISHSFKYTNISYIGDKEYNLSRCCSNEHKIKDLVTGQEYIAVQYLKIQYNKSLNILNTFQNNKNNKYLTEIIFNESVYDNCVEHKIDGYLITKKPVDFNVLLIKHIKLARLLVVALAKKYLKSYEFALAKKYLILKKTLK